LVPVDGDFPPPLTGIYGQGLQDWDIEFPVQEAGLTLGEVEAASFVLTASSVERLRRVMRAAIFRGEREFLLNETIKAILDVERLPEHGERAITTTSMGAARLITFWESLDARAKEDARTPVDSEPGILGSNWRLRQCGVK